MKILLIGEYSNVHWTLSQGLRALGHEVTVVLQSFGRCPLHAPSVSPAPPPAGV